MNYVECIGRYFPQVQVACFGDPDVYENLVWEKGDPIPPKETLDELSVEARQNDVWAKIKVERDRLRQLGVLVTVGTDGDGQPIKKWFNSDDTSRIQQISLVLMGNNLPANLQWKCMDNTYVTMTPTIALAVFQTTAYYDQTNFANAERHRLLMLQAAVPEDYDYSDGWLPRYNPL